MAMTDQPVIYTAPTLLEAQGMAMVNRERDRGRRVVLKVSGRPVRAPEPAAEQGADRERA